MPVMVLVIIALPALAFLVASGLIAWMLKSPLARTVLDHPNERSLHVAPMPRTGGLAIMIAIAFAGIALLPGSLVWLAPTAALAALSFVDDLRGLPVVLRFAVQIAVAGIFASWVLAGLPALWIAAAVIATTWLANLYNFMDGSDGLAGGMAVIGFGYTGLAALAAGDAGLGTTSLSITGAAAAFLVFNFHPARIFMGDVGSVPLGFLAAAIGMLGWRTGAWPVWFPILVFSPFIVDATITLARRLLRGDRVWQAHKEHYYQRLIRLGLGHRRTALIEYLVMLAAGASALWAAQQDLSVQSAVLAVWCVLYALGMIGIDRLWKERASA
jgi:UDP-N-acetylmuramyl pentapeptide phosphotransferase/UDP-N-acetylglucosamine-1-phosphate transferase